MEDIIIGVEAEAETGTLRPAHKSSYTVLEPGDLNTAEETNGSA